MFYPDVRFSVSLWTASEGDVALELASVALGSEHARAMQSKAETVDEYLDEIPEDRRSALGILRRLILEIAPTAQETMLYGMPAYLLGETFCAFASQKHYMALYCCDDLVDQYRPRLGKLNCGKGCIRFRKLNDLPMDVISSLLNEVAELRMGEEF
jgi:uncharacterized protein YdhG (YjbR/CyaY superfamily)